jgi:chemotaxis protein CheX
MVFEQKKDMKTRKNILIVDNNSELEHLVREPLLAQLKDSSVSPIVVRAKDGAEAAIKTENQKFDMVLIDTEVPRLL